MKKYVKLIIKSNIFFYGFCTGFVITAFVFLIWFTLWLPSWTDDIDRNARLQVHQDYIKRGYNGYKTN